MLSSILNDSNVIIGVTYIRCNSSVMSYLRFLAKINGFYAKNIKRVEKVCLYNHCLVSLFKGPVHVFYSAGTNNLNFINKIKMFSDITLIFIVYKDLVVLKDNLLLQETENKYKANNSLSIISVISKLNFNLATVELVFILDAYSKSVDKWSKKT